MKLRILDNSVRLRLNRAEVELLRDTGAVSSATRFPAGVELRYSLESNPAGVAATAQFEDNRLWIRLPESTVNAWADSEQVSIEDQQVLGDGAALSILVEKDFACLAPREGENPDELFAHPEAGRREC